MSPKTYALSLCAVVAAVFAGIVATNVIIDAQGVFETGLLPPPPHPNQRYQRFSAYQLDETRFDGAIFGSSRAQQIPRDELSARMNGVRFADFAVPAGLLDDHLPVLEYILRPGATPQRRLRAVFLMIDIDNFGNPPVTNRYHNTWLAPTLTGESVIAWWWRHLTALQFDRWRAVLKEIRLARQAALRSTQEAARSPIPPPTASAPPPSGPAAAAPAADDGAKIPRLELPFPTAAVPGQPERITARADFERQLHLFERFVTLCRSHAITLTVVISPMHYAVESSLDPDDMRRAVDALSRVVPLWDFSRTSTLTNRPELWHSDRLHFSNEISYLMLRRIFSAPMPPGWEKFGELHQHAAS